MRLSVAVERTTQLVERLATLMVELTLAVAVILGAIFVGHELREWRDWYWAAYPHPAESTQPAPEGTEP